MRKALILSLAGFFARSTRPDRDERSIPAPILRRRYTLHYECSFSIARRFLDKPDLATRAAFKNPSTLGVCTLTNTRTDPNRHDTSEQQAAATTATGEKSDSTHEKAVHLHSAPPPLGRGVRDQEKIIADLLYSKPSLAPTAAMTRQPALRCVGRPQPRR